MSRSPIPGIKSVNIGPKPIYKKQVCIYAFNKEELIAFSKSKEKTANEHFEDIDILRFLDIGFKVRLLETSGSTIAVDHPEDISKVEKALKNE